MKQKIVRYYKTQNGKAPFEEWINKLHDPTTQARVFRRLDRVALGHYGDYKSIGDGVLELRLAFGAGYRIYFGEQDNITVILLIGGDKSTQVTDIKKAKNYWLECKIRGKLK